MKVVQCGKVVKDFEIGKLGNWEIGKLGNWEIGKLRLLNFGISYSIEGPITRSI